MGKILLGADAESLVRPELIGLEGVNFEAHEWLVPISNAAEAREYACAGHGVDEAWVVSSDDVSGINLAAALRADNAELPVYLVAFEPSGSDASRARQAGISGILSASGIRERFSSVRKREAMMRKVAELEPCMAPVDGETASAVEVGSLKLVPPLDPVAEPASSARACGQGRLRKGSGAFVISMLSGSGGVGKSTTAAISACLCAARGLRTAVIDCDFQFGDMRHIMGGAAGLCIDDVLEDPAKAASLASGLKKGVPALAYAPDRLERSEELGCHVAELLDVFSSEFDAVVVNTGSNWSEGHVQLLERSHCPVFLLDQRASSVRSCQHALDLCLRLGIATGPFVYALNRCERGSLFCALDIANVMHGAQVFELKDGGTEVEELLGAGLAGELASSRNGFCASVEAMLGEVLP